MIETPGDLLDVQHGIIVQGCNAQGVMGAGLAKAVVAKYPAVFGVYRKAYQEKGLKVGQIVWYTVRKDEPKLAIANAITQEFYGGDKTRRYVDYDAVKVVFDKVAVIARQHNLPVHYPKIGAGLANGDWNVIVDIIQTSLDGLEHTLWVPAHLISKPARPRA